MAAVLLLAACRPAAWPIPNGFTVLPGAVDQKRLVDWASLVDGFIEREHLGGSEVRKQKNIPESEGFSVIGMHGFDTLRPIYHELQTLQKLHDALSSLLGPGYRVMNKNDVYVDRGGAWHIDVPNGAFSYYTEGLPSYWDPLPDGETARVVTVVIYLEDHSRDERALTVLPGTNEKPHGSWGNGVGRQAKPAGHKEHTLQPSLGDIIVFDARLWHRGMDRKHQMDTYLHRVPRRRCLSFDFGARNAFSDRVELAYAMRNAFVNHNNVSINH